MKVIDLTTNPRLRQAAELYQTTSIQTDPVELQKEYGRRIRDIFHTAGYISLSTRGLKPGEYRITRQWLHNFDPDKLQDNWKYGHLLPVHTGGWLGEIIKSPIPKLFHAMDLRDDPVLGNTLKGIGSAIASPLFEGGQPLNWGISFREEPYGFTEADAEDFFHRGNMIGGMVRSLVHGRRVRELNEQLMSQLEAIANIQRSLLPERTPDVAGVKIATSYLTSNESGGDYYDFFDMGKGRFGVIVADVAGHGAGAATVMAMMQSILHDFQERDRGPAAMLTHANRQMAAKRIENSFTTAFMGVIDENRETFTYANAGHNHPVRRIAPGEVVPISNGGSLPLGIMDDTQYEQQSVRLANGETLVLYTDGITEAFSPPPDKTMFGMNGLVSAVEYGEGNPDCVIEAVHERLFEHTHARDRKDDQTLVALRIER